MPSLVEIGPVIVENDFKKLEKYSERRTDGGGQTDGRQTGKLKITLFGYLVLYEYILNAAIHICICFLDFNFI